MNLEDIKAFQREKNLITLKNEVYENWVVEKIQNHLKRNPYLKYSVEDIQKKILEDDEVASHYIKEPSRQNITENFVADLLKNIKGISDFKNYSSNVSLFIVDGSLTTKRSDGVKSIDYSWIFNKTPCFASQKYINEKSGGAQDNQFNDIITFLKNCENNNLPCSFFAIVDGGYFTESKMNILKKYESKNVFVCSISDLEKVLNE